MNKMNTNPGREPSSDAIARRRPKPLRSLGKAIPMAVAFSVLPFIARSDERVDEGKEAQTAGREEPAQERGNFSPELENIFAQLIGDPAIQVEVSQFREFLSGNTEGAQEELVTMIRTLDAKLTNHPLKEQFDELVRAEIRRQNFSSLDDLLEELGISLSDKEKWAFYLYITSILMGLGIAFDVIAANIGRFKKSTSVKGNILWASELGASHIVLPIAGGALAAAAMGGSTFFGPEAVKWVGRGVGGLSVYLIARILKEEIFEKEEKEENESAVSTTRLTVRAKILRNVQQMWTVSADAASSGPAKYTETTLQYWKPDEILQSILIGGAVVAICSMISGLAALKLNRKYQKAISEDSNYSAGVVEKIQKVCLAGETGILGYFALNAGLNQMLSLDVSRLWVMLCSALGTAGVLKWKERSDKKTPTSQ